MKATKYEVFVSATPIHTVFMWATEQHLRECEAEMDLRGYRRHCRFIWDKMNGVCPAFTIRYAHEYLIWYYKPKMMEIDIGVRGKYTTVFQEAAREHSRKPYLSYRMVNDLYPNARKIDVFSREAREGWDQWGNQTNHFNNNQLATSNPINSK